MKRSVVVLLALLLVALLALAVKFYFWPYLAHRFVTPPKVAVCLEEKLLAVLPEGYGGHRYLSIEIQGIFVGTVIVKGGPFVLICDYTPAAGVDWSGLGGRGDVQWVG